MGEVNGGGRSGWGSGKEEDGDRGSFGELIWINRRRCKSRRKREEEGEKLVTRRSIFSSI